MSKHRATVVLIAVWTLLLVVVFGTGCSGLKIRAATPAEVEWNSISQASWVLGSYSRSREAILRAEWSKRWGYPSLYAYQQAMRNATNDAPGLVPMNPEIPAAPGSLGSGTLLTPETLERPRQ